MAVDRNKILLPLTDLYSTSKDAISLRYTYNKLYGNYSTSYRSRDSYGDSSVGAFFGNPRTPYGFYENEGKISIRAELWQTPKYPSIYNSQLTIPSFIEPSGEQTGVRTISGACGVAFFIRTYHIANNTMGYYELEFIDNPSKTSEEFYSGYSYMTHLIGSFISIRDPTIYFCGLVEKTTNPLSIDTSKIVCGLYADGSTVSLYISGVAIYQASYSAYRLAYSDTIQFRFRLNQGSNFLPTWKSTEDANDYSFETSRGYVDIYGEQETLVSFSPINTKFLELFRFNENEDVFNGPTSVGYMAIPASSTPDPLWRNYARTAEINS